MWEKKDSLGGGDDFDNPHDADNNYTWSIATAAPDGTAFTDFLVRLNTATNDPSVVGFAGYTDWRLPTIVELQTLLLEPFPCSISPCIVDPVFAPMAAATYWSSTSRASNPNDVWGVGFHTNTFFQSGVFSSDKNSDVRVRAVRGGR